ncbi:MAG: hypothetical protein HQL66_12410 [Magnetococcales bacterium]|nr:hypothetical protein [Magnetococcales bacterium]
MFESDGKRKELQAIGNAICTGFLLLVDVKDSTDRKDEFKRQWVPQMELLYGEFRRFVHEVHGVIKAWKGGMIAHGGVVPNPIGPMGQDPAAALGDSGGSRGSEESREREPVVKFIGDGCLAFFPWETSRDERGNLESVDHELAANIVRMVLAFREAVCSDDDLHAMRLKTVVAFLTNINQVEIEGQSDILGRGIDFCFRLEKFADGTHIVMNDYLRKILDLREGGVTRFGGSEYDVVACRKKMKGWEEPQSFYLLVRTEDIENYLTAAPSPYQEDVRTELIGYLIGKWRSRGPEKRSSWFGRAEKVGPEKRSSWSGQTEEVPATGAGETHGP